MVECGSQIEAWRKLEAEDVARAWAEVHVSSGDIGQSNNGQIMVK